MNILIKDVKRDNYFADGILTCPIYLKRESERTEPELESEKIYKFVHKCVIDYINDESILVKPITSAGLAYDIFTVRKPMLSHVLEADSLGKHSLVYVALSKFKLFKSDYVPGIMRFGVKKELAKQEAGRFTVEIFDKEKVYIKPEMLYRICDYCKHSTNCRSTYMD